MGDLDYGIRFTGDASGAKAATTDVENGLARVSKSLRATAGDADLTKAHWDALNEAHGKNATSAEENAKALKDLDDELATLMSRLDPAYRATKQFQDGQGVLTDGLKQNLITQQQYDGALASLTSRFSQSGEAAGVSALGTAQARRELIVLGHEAMTGNFSRMPGSFMVLANRMGATALLFNPITAGIVAVGAAGAVLGELVAHAESFNRVLNSIQTQLEATGRGSMVSTEELKGLIEQMALMPGMSKDAAEKTLAVFAQTHAIGGGLFKDLALLVNDFAAATGETAPAATKKLATSFADPAAGAETLHKEFGLLTAAQVLSIEQMGKQNDVAGAQKAFFDDLRASIAGLAEKGLTPLQKATNDVGVAWDRLTKSMGDSGAIKGVSVLVVEMVNSFAWIINHSDQIASALKLVPIVGPAVSVAQGGLSLANAVGGDRSASGKITTGVLSSDSAAAKSLDDQVTAALKLGNAYTTLTERAKALEVTQRAVDDALSAQAASINPDVSLMQKLGDQSLALTKAVADAWRAAGAEGRQATQGQIDATLKLRETAIGMALEQNDAALKLRQISQADHDANKTALELQKNMMEQIAAEQSKLIAGHTAQEKATLDVKLQQLRADQDAIALKGSNQQAIDALALSDAQDKTYADMQTKIAATNAAENKRLDDAIAKQTLFNAEIGKTAAEKELEKARIQTTATADMQAQADALRDAANSIVMDQQTYDIYVAQAAALDIIIAKRKTLSRLETDAAPSLAAAAAAKKSVEDWKKAGDEIERSLTDALMRGFEAGKPFGANFIDSLKHSLETAGLRVVVKAVLDPVMGTAQELVGGSSGIGSALNLFSSGSNFIGVGGTGILGSSAAYSAVTGGSMAAGSQAAMLAEQTGEFGAAGLAATAGASTGMTALATAIPYVGIALAAASALGLFGGKDRTASPQFSGLYSDSTITSGGFKGGPYGQAYTAMGSSPTDIWGGSTPMALPADQLSAFNVAIKSVFDQMSASAKAVGIDTSALEGLTVHMGATGNGVQADMTAALNSTADTIAQTLIPNIASLQQNGETLAQTFARVTGAQAQATAAAAAQVDALAKVRQSWQDQVDVLTGARTQLQVDRANQLASTTDAATQALMNQVFALQDQKTAADAAAQAAQDQAAAEAQLAQARQSWQDQVDVLTGARTQLQVDRANQLASTTDAATQALMNQTFALQDQKTAADAAAQAQKDQAAATQAATQATAQAIAQDQQQIASAESTLGSAVQGLASKLHIDTLLAARNSLATSEFLSPTDRFSAAQNQLANTYAAASGGDLTAVQNFPAMLQSTLSLARDVYASGPQFQQLFVEGNRELNDLLSRQSGVQNDILRDIPITIQQSGADTVAAVKAGFAKMAEDNAALRAELRRLTANT